MRIKNFIKSSVYILLFMIGWDILHYILKINSTILPTFKEVFLSFYNNFNTILLNTFTTLIETCLGVICTIIFSFGIVILIHQRPTIKKIFLKFIYVFQMIPLIAIAPLLILWLGIGISAKIILIMLYSSFVIIISTLDAFDNISPSHKAYILSLTKSKFKCYRYLYFPMSYTNIFSSIKVAITYSVGCAITGEYLGSRSGLGILLNSAYSSYQTDLVFAIIIMIVLLTIFLLLITNLIEKKLRG